LNIYKEHPTRTWPA